MQLAIFDVDGTLVRGKSTEKRFMAWLMRQGHIGPRQLFCAAWFVLYRFPRYGRHVFRKNKAYLSGLSEAIVSEEASRFVASLPETAWIQPTLQEVRAHRERGDKVILMSGTLTPIIEALAAHINVDAAVGTTCPIVDGRYTAAPPTRHPFHDDKATLLEDIERRYGIGAAGVYAYADSRWDIPILERAGKPVAVGPDRVLAAWARARQCRIIDYR